MPCDTSFDMLGNYTKTSCVYEEEKKAQEESRKKKCRTSNQPTITAVVERSEYPSKLNYDICQLYEAGISDNQHILCLYDNRDIC